MLRDDFMDMYRHDFLCFNEFAFNILHNNIDYLDNWHLQLLAYNLTLLERGQIKQLLVTMPPGMMKSECISVAFVAWLLGRNPSLKILCLHSSLELGYTLHDLTSELMRSPRYQALFRQTRVKPNRRKLRTDFGGERNFTTMTSKLMGLHADIIIIDDPISASDVFIDHVRDGVTNQFEQNIFQRLNRNGSVIVTMQRLHDNDLGGYLQNKPGWTHINLSAIALQDEQYAISPKGIYHRKKGEVLHPQLQSREDLIKITLQIGGRNFAYQYLQAQYKTQFGDDGHGILWTTPLRKGKFWDVRKDKGFTGAVLFSEADFLLPRVFGIGDDPCPADMRHSLNMEEYMIAVAEHTKNIKKILVEQATENGEYEYLDNVWKMP